MKKFILVLVIFIGLISCKDPVQPEPPIDIIPPVVIEKQPEVVIDTMAYETKEPFATLSDRGFEAYLVIRGFDTDNQVNGKISAVDANNIKYLSLFTNDFDETKLERYNFVIKKFRVELIIGSGQEAKVKDYIAVNSLQDLRQLPNLENFNTNSFVGESVYINFENKIKFFSLLSNHIKFINLDDCKEMLELSVSSNYNESTLNLNISKLKKLRHLGISGNIEKIDFSHNNVTSLFVGGEMLTDADYRDVKTLRGFGAYNAPNLRGLLLPSTIYNLRLERVGTTKFNSTELTELQDLYLIESNKFESLDLSNSKTLFACRTTGCKTLNKIILHPELKLDSLKKTGVHGGALWLKDPWTTWVLKK